MTVYQTNAGLDYKQLAYLVRIEYKTYLCIGTNCNTDMYTIGEKVELEYSLLEKSNFKVTDSPLFGTFLFDYWLYQNN